jgi:hypothetical protein
MKTIGLPQGCVMGWNYFGTGHGKGQWDGAIAHVKSVLCSEQVKIVGATKLHNALDVCNFYKQVWARHILITLQFNDK